MTPEQGPEPLGWLASVRLLGFRGAKAAALDLVAACDLIERGVTGTRRRAAIELRLSRLLEDLDLGRAGPSSANDLTPPTARELIDVLLRGQSTHPRLRELLTQLAWFAGTSAQMRAVATRDPVDNALAAAAANESGQPTFAFLDLEIDGNAETVGIVLERAGRRIAELDSPAAAASVITEWLEGTYVVAHNGDDFDYPQLIQRGVELPVTTVDSLRWAWLVHPAAESHSLSACCARADIEVGEDRHTALADARLLADYFPVLRGQLEGLRPEVRGVIAQVLDGVVHADVRSALLDSLGEGPPQWRPVPLRQRPFERPVARDRRRMVRECSDLATLVHDADANEVICVRSLRDTSDLPDGVHGFRLPGSRLIDRTRFGTVATGWAHALGVQLIEECEGILDLGPPAATELLHQLPTHGDLVVEFGSGPLITDFGTLADHPPEAPVTVVDAGEQLFAAPPERPHDALIFDPSHHDWPVVAAGAGIAWNHPAIRDLWTRVLGSPDVEYIGSPPSLECHVVQVMGVPAGTAARLSRVAGVAAASAERVQTVLVVGAADRDVLTTALRTSWRQLTGRGLMRPPQWPTYFETRSRLASQAPPNLAVTTAYGFARLQPDADAVFDRIGAPSPEHRLVRRLLDGCEADDDVFGSVIEPITALRFRRMLQQVGPHRAFICDPFAGSPLLRSACSSAANWSTVPLAELEDSTLTSKVREAVLLHLESTQPDAAQDAEKFVDDAIRRLLPHDAQARPFQREIVAAILAGRHSLAVFRTGMGKSLCYQASGLALSAAGAGLSIVVSPLIALQRDQVSGLHALGVWQAVAINHELTTETRAARLRGIAAGFYTMIFVAPEGLRSPALARAIQSTAAGIGLFVVDEAHCISEMGHDFRPSYRQLSRSLRRLAGVPDTTPLEQIPGRPRVLALTGTARPAVRADIKNQLAGTMSEFVDTEFLRPELRFGVRRIDGRLEAKSSSSGIRDERRYSALLETLASTQRPSIIYALTIRDVETLADRLRADTHLRVVAYHAKLDSHQRRERELRFREDDLDIVVATKAFGMGIDKDDIKAVIHWEMPESPEALYQEAGRAGRGPRGQPADCIVLYRPEDLDKSERIAATSTPTRAEIESAWSVLSQLRQPDRESNETVIITDADLRALARLRVGVDLEVVLAYLEDVGLVRDVETGRNWELVRRLTNDAEDLDPAEQAIFDLTSDNLEPLSIDAVCDRAATRGHRVTISAVYGALHSLQSRGVLQRVSPPSQLSVAATDGDTLCTQGWANVARVRDHLQRNVTDDGWCYLKPASELGLTKAEAATALEVMTALGHVQCARTPADGRLPGVMPTRTLDHVDVERLAEVSRTIWAVTKQERRDDSIATLAGMIQQPEKLVRQALIAAQLFGAIAHDPASWAGEHTDTTRLMRLPTTDAATVADAIQRAADEARERRQEDRLRRMTLARYTDITPPEGGDDAYQQYLHQYFTDPTFLDDLRSEALDQDILANLTDEQRAAVTTHTVRGERLAIRAGPGTGKTRTLMHRIAYRVMTDQVAAEQVVALTFSRPAAAEMTARLARLRVTGVRVATLNALGNRSINDYFKLVGFDEPPQLLTDAETRQLIQRILSELGSRGSVDFNALAARLSLARAALATEPVDLARLPPRSAQQAAQAPDELVLQVMRRYAEVKRAAGRIDYQDQIALGAEILATEAGDLITRDIAEVYVDEAQDLSRLDWQLVKRLARNAARTAVGDPRQAIYEWRGALPAEFEGFFERADVQLDLVESHRSTGAIIDAANQLMRHYPPLRSLRPFGAPVRVMRFDDTDRHDDGVATVVQESLDHGVANDQIAVLAKSNQSVDRISRRLLRERIATHRIGLTPLTKTVGFRVARQSLSIHLIEQFESVEIAMKSLLAAHEEQRALEGREPLDEEALDDWQRLVAALEDQASGGIIDPSHALANIAQSESEGTSQTGVTVSTMTSAKGLEWDVVIIAEASRTNMFVTRQSEEFRRVFYVAITRPRVQLVITWHGDDISELAREAGLGLKARASSTNRGPHRSASPSKPRTRTQRTTRRRGPQSSTIGDHGCLYGGTFVRRTGPYGDFYGCTKYPDCRRTRSI